MQGLFRIEEGDERRAEELRTDFSLAHEPRSRQVRNLPPAPAAGAAGAAGAGAGAAGAGAGAAGAGAGAARAGAAGAGAVAAGPGAVAGAAAPPLTRTVMIYAPMQRFTLDDLLFFIEPKSSLNEQINGQGKWIVPYVLNDAPAPAPPLAAAGPPRKLASPESAQGEIPARDRDNLTLPDLQSVDPEPDPAFSQQYRHFLLPDPPTQRVVGEIYLKPILESAERLDYDFALRMQGLQNTTVNAVWTCSESGGAQPEDRAEMMDQFLRSYLSRFLSKVPQTFNEEPEDIIQEAVQMHQQFCSGWVREHKRSLSPAIESCAEALVGLFWDGALRPAVRPGMTWKQMSRVIRRDSRLSPQFGLCLHFYMVKLEQDRGSRNASYKSMFNASSANMLAINSMDAFLRKESGYLARLTQDLLTPEQRRFHVSCVDWYLIVSQLPPPKMEWTGLKKSRLAAPRPEVPWARRLQYDDRSGRGRGGD